MQTKLFLLKAKTNSNGLAPLRFVIHHLGLRLEIPALEKIKPSAWQHKKQKVGRSQQHATYINTQLQLKKNFLESTIYKHITQQKQITQQDLNEAFKKQFIPNFIAAPKADPTSLSAFFAQYKAKYQFQKSPEYLRGFDQVLTHLLTFKPNISFKIINLKFMAQYIDYLINNQLTNNTIQIHVKKIRQICKEAAREGLLLNKEWEDFHFKGHTTKPFWLSWSEIQQLANYSPQALNDQQILDEFLFRCYTGLRQSDSAKIKKENILFEQNRYYLSFTTQKTTLQQKLALADPAVKILKNYQYNLPSFSQQTLNIRIKNIARLAGITGQQQKTHLIGSHRYNEVRPRWQMVTTHTARRSFARNWADQNGDIIKLSKYLGHSSPAITMQYIGYDTQEIDQELLKVFSV